MATVFSNVEADIADDLVGRFPQEFDFDAMLRKVCEDAGVVIVDQTENGGDKSSKYRLKGLWLAMEKAYKHLVTTLALYGARLPETFSEQNKTLNLESEDYGKDIIDEIKALNDDTADRDYNPGVQNILQDILSEEKRPRRPRKSARQSRKIGELSEFTFDDEDDDEFEDYGIPKAEMEASSRGALHNNEGKSKEEILSDETERAVNGDENEKVADVDKESEKPKKRGRPRKNKSPYHLTVKKTSKKRAPHNKKKVVVPITSVSIDEMPSARRRGRPKVYDDEGKTEFPCSECSFVAKKRAKLRSHRLRMHLSSPTKCDLCTKVFPNKRYMLRHRASHVAPQHCCDVCGKMYKIRKAMLEHRKTHDMNYKKVKVKCEMCPKSFCNRYILECHIRDIHMGQKKSYLCSTCGKSFTTKHSLAEHTNAHTGVKPHVCEHCGKSFSYESALRDHRYTHTDAKHFWCNHCQKGFSQRSGLKMHMRIHRQHKMFVCSECGRGFTQKQALQRHERVHKGEKPFVCKHCGRFFTDASIIRRHLILVHKIHKDANTWREDIVCTVKAQNDYQVQKVGEENLHLELEAEKEKEDILKVVGAPPRNSKGPSRAFSRTYPRRVALLDEDGNVIAPPEVPSNPPIQRPKNSDSESPKVRSKTLNTTTVPGTSLILTAESSSDVDSNSQVLNQRFVEASQWDALAGQLTRGATSHIEHIILDDTAQHEIQRGIEHVQGLHKIIKYENLQPSVDSTANTHNVLSHSQGSQSPSTSPASFVPHTAAHTRTLETTFDSLNPQTAHAGNQYYDGRTSGHSGASWSSMFYYSQLASQFGMSINTDYPYVGGTSGTGGTNTHLGHYTSTPHQGSPTTLILQTQSHNLHLDSVKSEEHRNHNQSTVNAAQVAAGLSVPTLQTSQDITQARHGIKLGIAGGADTLQAELILQHDLQEHSPSHGLGTADGSHHVTTIDQLASGLSDSQNLLVRPLASQVSASSRQSSPSIPSRNSALQSLKHK